ncbi:hypothetical protein D9M72_363690 [compost metagenome]
MADLTMAGDHVGCLLSTRAPNPAMCGAAMEVPDMKPNCAPLLPMVETPARTFTPGAEMSGFRRSPPEARLGPREEKPATWGAGGNGSPVRSPLTRLTVSAGLAESLDFSSRLLGALTCTVGTTWLSASSELEARLTRIMPTPPFAWTSRLFAVRSTTPRSQTTTLPVTLAASSVPGPQRFAAEGASGAAASAATTTAASLTSDFMMDAPRNMLPSDTFTVPSRSLGKVDAATVVSHGEAWFTVDTAGPELPADAETNTPAAAAFRNARATGSVVLLVLPEME